MTARRKPSVAGLTRTLAAERERHKAEVAALRAQLVDAHDEIGVCEAEARDLDPEAIAVDGCAKVLNRLCAKVNPNDAYRANTYGTVTVVTLPPVGRVLEYLRRRYGIPDAAGQVEHLTRQLDELKGQLNRAQAHLDDVRRAADGSRF